MRFVIDGTTGLLGRNLLFEILKQNLKCLDEIEIIILGKGSNGVTLESRMNGIILDDGSNYLNLPIDSDYFAQIKSRIKYIEFDLTKPLLDISKNDIEKLKDSKIDYFYHIAALTSFFNTSEIIKQLNIINLDGTKHILNLVKELTVKQFIYVGSAYHAGASRAEIYPDYFNKANVFRNHYEKTKQDAELYLIEFAKKEHINYKIYRPTTIAGRLIEKEIGSINKFDVFYEWGRWILKYKMKILKDQINPYDQPLELFFRITKHIESGMNIIPADYAAKLLYYSTLEELNDIHYHLVNDFDIPTSLVAKLILNTLNIDGYTFSEKQPEDKNQFEKFYFRTVGQVFTPYVIDPPLYYNNDNLKDVMKEHNLKCPEMNEANFQKLMDYAKKNNFGIEKK